MVRTGLGITGVPQGALDAPNHAHLLAKTRGAVVMDVMVMGGAAHDTGSLVGRVGSRQPAGVDAENGLVRLERNA